MPQHFQSSSSSKKKADALAETASRDTAIIDFIRVFMQTS
jgi:hypothetical protein